MGRRSDNSGTTEEEGAAASSSFLLETWEPYGVAIFASRTPHWFRMMRRALETGEIIARANESPPASNNAIYDAAQEPTPEWWKKYHSICDDNPPAPAWAEWLSLNVYLQLSPTLNVYEKYLEAMREHYGDGYHRDWSKGVWNDLETLAWFVSRDIQLAEKLQSFERDARDYRKNARAQGLRYLCFHVARHHCNCAAKLSLHTISTAGQCTCLVTAWEALADCLRKGHLSAQLVTEDGNSRNVNSGEFFAATLNIDSGEFSFISAAGDLLFEQSEVQALSRSTGTTTTKVETDGLNVNSNVRTRAPSVKKDRSPSDEEIKDKAQEMKDRGLRGHDIASQMRHEPGFENVATTVVRALNKGRWKGGRPPRTNKA